MNAISNSHASSRLPILPVVQAPGKTPEESIGFLEDGIAINSPIIDGLPTPEAKKKIIAWLHERGHGHPCVRYKLRDWLFSRQRYWGEPFPIVWRDGRHEALPESELPLEPPELADFKPTGTGEPPLAKAKDWIRYSDTADAGNKHDAAVGGFMLVLPAVLRSAK